MSSCQEAELNTVTYHALNKYEQRREGKVNHFETGAAQASWIPHMSKWHSSALRVWNWLLDNQI